jgi:hypothetical protein
VREPHPFISVISIRKLKEKQTPELTGEKLGSGYLSTVFFFNSGFVCASEGSGSESGGGTRGWANTGAGVTDDEGGTGVESVITSGVMEGRGNGGATPGGGNGGTIPGSRGKGGIIPGGGGKPGGTGNPGGGGLD